MSGMVYSSGFAGGVFFTNTTDHVAWCLAGVLLSLYALYVETKKKNNPHYVAVCDINDSMSCSRVLTSEYSRGFGLVRYLVGESSPLNVPNCILGILAYSLQLVIGLLPYTWTYSILLYISTAALLSSLYLAYVLFFVLRDVCIVCMCTYITNAVLLYLSYQRYQGSVL